MIEQQRTALTILRRKQVEKITGLSRSTLYDKISNGTWPRPISLGLRAVGFPLPEIEAMISALIAGKSEEEIKELVTKLEAARKSFA
ncbi:helix-turn-helix transcriptional regulator [Ampullimonas aquatilis]|uniref:helix-turn-helix transcriptional regulator n=1 Tax=Ampullimonas aquatilis TaxID=1341549 RepID=UPI003C739A26